MPEHIKSANQQSEEFESYLKDFVNSRSRENSQKNREELKEKAKKFAASIAVMLAG